MLLASALIHSAALISILIAAKIESAKISYRPGHTVVEIVDAGILKSEKGKPPVASSSREAPAGLPRPMPKAWVPRRSVATGSPTLKKQAEKQTKEKTAKTKASDKASLDKKIAAMEKGLKQKDAEESVRRRIKEFEGKSEGRKTGPVKKEIEDLRRELAEQAKENRKVSAGADIPGGPRNGSVPKELFELTFKTYYNTVGSMIQSSWIYSGEIEKNLSVWLAIRISPAGELVSIRVEKRSGDAIFDESAIRAVRKAAPFPQAPEEIKNEFSEPLIIRFCPGGCAK